MARRTAHEIVLDIYRGHRDDHEVVDDGDGGVGQVFCLECTQALAGVITKLHAGIQRLETALRIDPTTPLESARLRAQRFHIDRLTERLRQLQHQEQSRKKHEKLRGKAFTIRESARLQLKDEVQVLRAALEEIRDHAIAAPSLTAMLGIIDGALARQSDGAREFRDRVGRYNRALKHIVCLGNPDYVGVSVSYTDLLERAIRIAFDAVQGPLTTYPDGKLREREP